MVLLSSAIASALPNLFLSNRDRTTVIGSVFAMTVIFWWKVGSPLGVVIISCGISFAQGSFKLFSGLYHAADDSIDSVHLR